MSLAFFNIKDNIDPNNVVYVYKTVKNNPKDFGNDQISMKSDLSEIKLGNKKLADQENKKCF